MTGTVDTAHLIALARASELRLAGRPREALVELVRLPQGPEVERERALTLLDLGEQDEAFAASASAVALAADDPDTLCVFAYVALRCNEHEAALAAVEQAMVLAPDDVHVLLEYARTAALWPDHEDRAAAAISAAIDLAPVDPLVARTFGDVLMSTGRFAAAADAYERALTLAPTDRTAHQNRASALLAIGRETAAVEGFWGVVHPDPGNASAVRGLQRAALGVLQRIRVLIGGAAVAAFVAGVPVGVITLAGWSCAAAMLATAAVLVVRFVRRNREPVVRLLRASRLLKVTSGILGVAVLLILLAPAAPWEVPWLPAAAFGLVMVASVLSFVLHYGAARPATGQPRSRT